MKDYLNNNVKIGDAVVFVEIDYRGLMKGKVIRITKRKVVIAHEETNALRTQSIQLHNRVIKI